MRTVGGAVAALLALGGATALAQTADLVDRAALRVCADPANMPFSNAKKEGFENKIAELLGKEMELPVLYTWFPMATGFVRNTLNAKRCDVIMGYAQGDTLVQNTNAYYRTAYVLLYPKDGPLAGVKSLSDEKLKDKRLGVIAGTPPANAMAMAGLMSKAKGYRLVVDRRFESPAEEMIADLNEGEIDAAVLWGPMGGFYAKKSGKPLDMVPLLEEKAGPRLTYRITMGIRNAEDDWKHKLNDLIAKKQNEINAILLEYGVPILDEQNNPIAAKQG